MDAGKGALALGAIILYAAVRVAVDAFYGNFDATAEDAGLTYSSILTRAAIGFVDYVLVLSVAVLGAFVLLDAWRRHKTDSKPILVDAGSVGDNYSDVKRATSLFLIAAGVSVGLYAVGLTWRHPSLMFLGVVLS